MSTLELDPEPRSVAPGPRLGGRRAGRDRPRRPQRRRRARRLRAGHQRDPARGPADHGPRRRHRRRTRAWRSTTPRTAPPRLRNMNDDDRLLATVGRGLGIVAMYSTTWGAEVSHAAARSSGSSRPPTPTSGAGTWPVRSSTSREPRRGAAGRRRRAGRPAHGPAARRCRCRSSPTTAAGTTSCGASCGCWRSTTAATTRSRSELSELTLQVEQERRQAVGVDRLDAAIAAGQETRRPGVPTSR